MLLKLLDQLKNLPLWVWALTAIITIGGGKILILNHNLNEAQAQVVAVGLARDSAQAAADSLRDVTSSLEEALGAELEGRVVLETRILQLETAKDSIDHALHRRSVLNGQLEASIDELEARLEAITTQDGDNRVASFQEYIKPYTVKMDVRLPPPPEIGSAQVQVQLDSVDVNVRVQCGVKDDLTGVRPANVLWNGPEWFKLKEFNITQDPEVCNQDILAEAGDGPSTFGTILKWGERVLIFAGGVLVGGY